MRDNISVGDRKCQANPPEYLVIFNRSVNTNELRRLATQNSGLQKTKLLRTTFNQSNKPPVQYARTLTYLLIRQAIN